MDTPIRNLKKQINKIQALNKSIEKELKESRKVVKNALSQPRN